MRTIQEVGIEILNNQPASIYIFGGQEYGIKKKYLTMLKDFYKDSVECAAFSDIISIMSTKQIIPLQPKLYIVRYDEVFVSELNEKVASRIKSLNVKGTVACLYEDEKHLAKLDKFLPEYTVRIDEVSTQFKIKYLHSDFHGVPDKFIELAASYGANYNESYNICAAMHTVQPELLFALSDADIMKLFGKSDAVVENQIKTGVASRNFTYLVSLLENYEDLDSLYYTILSTMIEMEKVLSNSRASSSLREYGKRWQMIDVYNMFMNTYAELQNSRSRASGDTYNSLLYLFSLLKFEQIPSLEYMKESIA